MKPKLFVTFFIVSLLFSISSEYANSAVKFYQSNQIHKDGSITLNIVYSAKKTDLSENKMIGNLPFSEDAIQGMFSSPDSKIEKNLVYSDPKDNSITGVNVIITIKDINKISGIKAFKDLKTVWKKEGSEMMFKWNFPVSYMKDNMIDTYQFILTSEDQIKSSNGVFRDNSYDWFIYADKIDPKGAFFTAAINATDNNNVSPSSEKNVVSGEDNSMQDNNSAEQEMDKTNPEEKKSCGVFSIELPVIILLGMSGSYIMRKRKK